MNAQQHKEHLESQLSKIAGHQVEITIRGEREFTFSFDAIDLEAAQLLVEYVGQPATVETDAELEMTCVYIN